MTATHDTSITIRLARDEDSVALRRLAQLDGARLPDGEIRAALRISDSAYVADPCFASRELVGLLDVRAKRIRRGTISRLDRARTRLSLWSGLYHRASESRLML